MIFFPATTLAIDALVASADCSSYYNCWFHVDAITVFIAHILRTVIDLFLTLYNLVLLPICTINPLTWLWLPEISHQLLDSSCALFIAATTTVVHPFVTLLRTASSIIYGYKEDSVYDEGQELDVDAFERATMITTGIHL